jgi:hypothetical protein
MAVSLELSMVQQNRALSAQLEAATEEFERNGGVIERLEMRTFAKPIFNSEVISPSAKLSKAVNIQKSEKATAFERGIAEKLKCYVHLGVAVAAKDLGLGTRRLNFIASNYGIVFKSHGHSSAVANKEKHEALLLPDIKQAISEGATQQDLIRRFGIAKSRLVKMSKTHNFNLPGLVDEAADRKLIERIKAFAELGVPRTTCARCMQISQKKLWRIIDMYAINYPVKERRAEEV